MVNDGGAHGASRLLAAMVLTVRQQPMTFRRQQAIWHTHTHTFMYITLIKIYILKIQQSNPTYDHMLYVSRSMFRQPSMLYTWTGCHRPFSFLVRRYTLWRHQVFYRQSRAESEGLLEDLDKLPLKNIGDMANGCEMKRLILLVIS